MESFDKEHYINKIYSEFKKTDEFYNSFRKQFIAEILKICMVFYLKIEINALFTENLKLYADEILSTTESVIYKDQSYSETRINEELVLMKRIVVKDFEAFHNRNFIEMLHLKTKELIVQHYSNVIDLSGNGFRLLDLYTKMYNWEFVTNFYGLIEIQ